MTLVFSSSVVEILMRQILFEKYEQGGNDFIIVDARTLLLPQDLSSWSRSLCNRHKGVGADGLLLLFPSDCADYRVRIFNADGSEPALCGNGVSCLLTSFFAAHPEKHECVLEMMHTVIKARRANEEIKWNLGEVQILHFPIVIPDLGIWYVVNTGVPHAVSFVTEEMDVERVGKTLREHPLFAPHGVNVNFAKIDEDCILVRTYERGVEKETLSCGTGGAAVAFVAKMLYNLEGPFIIANRLDFHADPIVYAKQNIFSFVGNQVHMVAQGRKIFTGTMVL